jgi:ferritin-like metal-binding protein YciE
MAIRMLSAHALGPSVVAGLQSATRKERGMPHIASFNELLVSQMRDLYDAEKRLTKAIPKLGKAATNDELRTALEHHLEETEGHVSRLEQAFQRLGETAKAKPCAGMRGIIEEGDEHINEDYDDEALRDAVIIGSAQRVEHYEIAAYGTAIAHARLLGRNEIANLLEASLAEEKAADKKLTQIAETAVNLEAAHETDMNETRTGMRGMLRGRSASGERTMAHSRTRRNNRSNSRSSKRKRARK